MKGFNRWFTRLFISEAESTTSESGRAKYGIFSGWVSIVLNLFLGGIKIILGLVTGSIALIAESFHTIADSITSVIIVVSFSISRKPSDAEHPYGHGRAEHIAALVLAVLLIVISIEFFHTSVDRIRAPKQLNISILAISVIAISIFLKEWLARFSTDIANIIDSRSVKADAWHHRSDAIASLFVIIAMVGARLGYLWLDGIMGILVAFIIGVAGIKILKDAADRLIGEQPSRELLEKIYTLARSVDGVLNVHDVSIHSYGSTKMISLHAQVEQSLSPMDAHHIAETIETGINEEVESARTVVHIDPVDYSSPLIRNVVDEIKAFRSENADVVAFHDVRVRCDNNEKIIEFDFATKKGSTRESDENLKNALSERLKKKFPGYATRIEVDPDYFYQRPK